MDENTVALIAVIGSVATSLLAVGGTVGASVATARWQDRRTESDLRLRTYSNFLEVVDFYSIELRGRLVLGVLDSNPRLVSDCRRELFRSAAALALIAPEPLRQHARDLSTMVRSEIRHPRSLDTAEYAVAREKFIDAARISGRLGGLHS